MLHWGKSRYWRRNWIERIVKLADWRRTTNVCWTSTLPFRFYYFCFPLEKYFALISLSDCLQFHGSQLYKSGSGASGVDCSVEGVEGKGDFSGEWDEWTRIPVSGNDGMEIILKLYSDRIQLHKIQSQLAEASRPNPGLDTKAYVI